MPVPLIETKLYAPKLRRHFVTRPWLVDRLRLGADARLTLVSAPAGFGKTSLLADWLTQPDDRASAAVAWLSLDSDDGRPEVFWAYVAAALRKALPTMRADARLAATTTSVPMEALLTDLLNELASIGQDVWLVLDDYHAVHGIELSRAMTFFVEHLPASVHLVISSRSDPDLPLARWRAHDELVEVRAADLRFAREDVATYLHMATGLDLSLDDLAALEERTEGWIAAIQLAALSLRGRADASGFIARFAGDDRYVVDYLVEEVLARQPEHVRTFLLQSAVLDRFTASLCDAVTAGADGAELLRSLERANLFLVALDERREWYRYHHLFADVLRARLLDESPELAPLIHERASRWFEEHQLPEEAVKHALAGRNFAHAAHLIETEIPAIRLERRDWLILEWLPALPRDVVRASPVLSVFTGYVHLAGGELDSVEPWLQEAERQIAAVPSGEPSPWEGIVEFSTLPATIAVYRAALAQARGDIAATVRHAGDALRLAAPEDHLSRSGAAGFRGFAEWASGDVSAALRSFSAAVESMHAAGDLVDELSATVVLADMQIVAGRPSRARRLYELALRRAEAVGDEARRATAELHVGLSELDTEAGDVESAKRHLDAAAPHSRSEVPTESSHRWFLAMAAVARAEDDLLRAINLLDRAEQLYRPGFFPDVRPIAAARARVWIAQGRLGEADDWAHEAGVSATDPATFLREFDHLTLARLLIAQEPVRHEGSAGAALTLLDRLAAAAAADGRAGSLFEIRVLQALAHEAGRDRRRALEVLASALLELAEPASYCRLLLNEGKPPVTLLRELDRQGRADGLVRRVLDVSAGLGARAPGTPSSPAAALADPLSERELQVLRLLDSELSGPEIARELFVSHNTLRTHTKHIFTKLGVTSRRAAVLRGHDAGLI